MTQDEMIELAKQAGFEEHQAKFDTRFEPFAKLVAEKERQAIIGLADSLGWVSVDYIQSRDKHDS